LGRGEKKEAFALLPDYGITKTQEGIFVESTAHPQSCVYNIPVLLELSERIDLEKLKTAVKEAVNAHPYLKTRLFLNESGDIRQRRADDEPFDERDIAIIPANSIDEVKDRLVQPFTLLGGRLFRVAIVQSDKNYLFVEMHHIVCDGTSLLIFFDDVSKAYRGERLAPETYSGFEVSLTEEKQRQSARFEAAKAYYAKLFDGCDADCLPQGDLKKQAAPRSGSIRAYGEHSTAEDVRYYCEANKLTMNGFFTAVFGLTLAKFCRKDNAVFASIYNGRNDSRLDRTMAMFVKTLPVLCTVSPENGKEPIADYVRQTGNQLMESMANDLYSFGEIKRAFGVNADVMFAYQGEDFCVSGAVRRARAHAGSRAGHGESAAQPECLPRQRQAPIFLRVPQRPIQPRLYRSVPGRV